MANIEAGYIWNGHETLSHVANIPTYGAAGEFDRHATWVGMVMGGRPGGANPGEYQRGMAPDAQLTSGAIATSWPANNPSFPRFTTAFFLDYFGISLYGPYRAAFITGVPAGSRLAPGRCHQLQLGRRQLDPHRHGQSQRHARCADQREPAHAAHIGGRQFAHRRRRTRIKFFRRQRLQQHHRRGPRAKRRRSTTCPAFSSNGGPNDYYDPQNGTVSQARQVSISPHRAKTSGAAYYGGQTGGNGPSVFGPANDPAGGPNWYSRNVNGTSFAAPTVAGGAALLYDAAYALLGAAPDARDSRVMKAVLMNSADKTSGWNNGQTANPNGFGGVLTTRGLDNRVGAGRMDLNQAFDQFLSGTTDVARHHARLAGQRQQTRLGFRPGESRHHQRLPDHASAPSWATCSRPRSPGSAIGSWPARPATPTSSLRQPGFGVVERARRPAAEFDFRFEQPLQQHRTFHIRHSGDRPVHAARALDRGNVRFRRAISTSSTMAWPGRRRTFPSRRHS